MNHSVDVIKTSLHVNESSTTEHNGVFPKWERNSMNLANLMNHWSMNWSQFKYPVFHMCLAGAVVTTFWSLTQEVVGLNPSAVVTNILSLNLLNSVKHLGKTQMKLGYAKTRDYWMNLFENWSVNRINWSSLHDGVCVSWKLGSFIDFTVTTTSDRVAPRRSLEAVRHQLTHSPLDIYTKLMCIPCKPIALIRSPT